MFIDTHAHLNFSVYKEDIDKIIRNCLDNNVWVINVGSDYKTSKRALDIANKYTNGVYAAVGLHPIHTQEYFEDDKIIPAENFNYDFFAKLVHFEKVIAIGEIGLDYYHLSLNEEIKNIKDIQKKVFNEQLKLSIESNLPVIIHCRQAHDDMIVILENFRKKYRNFLPKNKPWAVMHCFSGDENLAWKYFNLGIIISFTGIITFSKQWDDLIRRLPLDKFMIETDSPFLTPEPFRGQRNNPILVKKVALRIAEIKNLPLERIEEMTTQTARKFFDI